MELKNTITAMVDSDYKARFAAELWDNRIYIPSKWTLQPFHETKKYLEFMNFHFPYYFF